MTRKDELEAALRSSAKASAPTPDRTFVDGLEQRLLTADEGKVVPFVRRARRLSIATAAAITFTVAGVAAAAGIVVTHPFRDENPRPAPSTVAATSSILPATTTPSANTSEPTSSTPAFAVTTVPSIVEPTTAATDPPTTVPVAPPPVTSPPDTAPVTTTTEVHTPATLTLSCVANGATVDCNWSAAPEGTARFAVLRSQVGAASPGRVFFVDVGLTTWSDPMAEVGVTYTYLVHAFDGADQSLGHSNAVTVGCC
jgi:hypothetical protein